MKRTIAGSFSMKQLNATPPNALPDGKPKRGRPSKPDALTGAERAKRFRDARRALPKSVTVTKNACDECVALRDEVRRLNHRLGEKEIQILADGITLKKSRATVLELRRELAKARQPANKRNATEVVFHDVVTSTPEPGRR